MMIPSSSGWSSFFMSRQLLDEVRRGVLDNPLGELTDPVVSQPCIRAKSGPVSTNAMNIGSRLFGNRHGRILASSYHQSTGGNWKTRAKNSARLFQTAGKLEAQKSADFPRFPLFPLFPISGKLGRLPFPTFPTHPFMGVGSGKAGNPSPFASKSKRLSAADFLSILFSHGARKALHRVTSRYICHCQTHLRGSAKVMQR